MAGWCSLNIPILFSLCSGPAIFRVHYEGHEYQPHINHVGQTERGRRLHNLPATEKNVPPSQAFRFDHQMAALICVQHTTLSSGDDGGGGESRVGGGDNESNKMTGRTLNGTRTTGRPQAIVHQLRPSPGMLWPQCGFIILLLLLLLLLCCMVCCDREFICVYGRAQNAPVKHRMR